MASVKWLTRIVVPDKPHSGFFQTFDYSVWERDRDGLPQLVPVTAIQPKAIIVDPPAGKVLKAGEKYTIWGFAWAGENAVAKVEVQFGGTMPWTPATVEKAKPFEYVRWEATVTPLVNGLIKVLARCTDDKGNTQPDKRDTDRRTYMINHLVPFEVTVK
jgi:hypothetical protein